MIRVLFGLCTAGAVFALGIAAAVFALPGKLTITSGVPASERRRAPEPPPPDRTDEVLAEVDGLREVLRAFAEALDLASRERDGIRAEVRAAGERASPAEALAALDRRLAALAGEVARLGNLPREGEAPAPAPAAPAPVAAAPVPAAAPAVPERRSLAALLAKREAKDVRDTLADYRLLPGHCRVGFDGSSTVHDFTARSGEVTGRLRLRLSDLADGAAGRVSVPVASLDSESEDRDEEIHTHLSDGGHPDLTCEVLGLSPGAAGGDGATACEGRVRFTIHGVSREAKVAVTVEFTSRRLLHVKGECRLKMSEFGIAPASKFGVISVDDEVTVWWDLYGEVDRARE